ncbi:MAG: Ig-like domain-containing protein, partial [Candidatus Micrarchaeota archaeon]
LVNFVTGVKPGIATIRVTRGAQVINTVFRISMPLSAVTLLKIMPANVTITAGSNTTFTLVGVDANVNEQVFTPSQWSVVNLTGGAVMNNATGTLTALTPGIVTLTARIESRSASANVTIILGQAHHFNVTGPTTTVAGQPISLNATLQDVANNVLSSYNGQAPQVVWSTSSGTIYPNGTLVATTTGTVTVTASLLQNSGVAGTFNVLVTAGAIDSLAVAESGSGIQVGNTYALTAMFVDKYGNRVADTDATWTILNATGTATLNGRLITPTKVGYVTVYAVSTANPALTATGVLTITAGQPTSITIVPPSASIRPGNTVALTTKVYDAFGNSYTYTNASWSTSNSWIAVVSSDGVLTALSPGSVTVTATIGSVSKSITVTVLQALSQQAQVATSFSTPVGAVTVPGQQQPRVTINTGTSNGSGLSGLFTLGGNSDFMLIGSLALLLVGLVAYWVSSRH